MWRTIYNIRFSDDDNGQWLVEVQSEDAAAAVPVELTPAGEPLEWKNNGSESQTDNLIGGTGTLRLVVTEDTAQHFQTGGILPTSALGRRVVVTREEILVWMGYIQMQTLSQDWEAAPVEMELPIMDTVEALDSIFIDKDETAQTTMELLRHAHAKAYGITEEEQPTDCIVTNQPQYWGKNGPTSKGWADAEVFNGFFVSVDGEDRKSYADAIGIILSPFGRLIQVAGRWAVVRDKTTPQQLYTPLSKTSSAWGNPEYAEYKDITSAVAGADNTQSTLPAPSKVTYSYEPEESEQEYDGDTVYEFTKDNIKTYNSQAPAVNVEWDQDGQHHLLRYMRIADSNLDQPLTTERHKMSTVWYNVGQAVWYWPVPVFSEGAITDNSWAQPVENENFQGWKARKEQTYMYYRYLLRETNQTLPWDPGQGALFDKWTLQTDIFTMKLHREAVTSNIFILKIAREMKTADMVDDANFSDNALRRTYFLQPFVQIYWSPVPWGDGVKPQKVFRFPYFNAPADAAPTWADCNDFFFPQNVTDTSMTPSAAFNSGGMRFHLPNGRGYIALRIYGSGWPIPYDSVIYNDTQARINNAAPFVLSDLKITNDGWVGVTPTRLLAWNTKNDTEFHFSYTDGTEELSLQFKTLADGEPTPATFLSPRRGFDDSMRAVVTPREMIDIEAVQVTEDGGIPGITRFSLFQFDGKIYFPSAIGMNARENTVCLKLIRTL